MKLELNSLQKAIISLGKAISVCERKIKESNIDIDEIETLKAGVIQNFEFTYELCWKFMKRWLEQNISSESVDGVTRKELFRMGAENRLIDDVEDWMNFHRARNSSSHIYDEDLAQEIYKYSVEFLNNAKELYKRLEQRND